MDAQDIQDEERCVGGSIIFLFLFGVGCRNRDRKANHNYDGEGYSVGVLGLEYSKVKTDPDSEPDANPELRKAN